MLERTDEKNLYVFPSQDTVMCSTSSSMFRIWTPSAIIFVFLAIIACIFLYRIVNVNYDIYSRKKSIFDIEKYNTGDLVFVAYDNFLGYFMRFWTGSPWTHVGMIMEDEGNLYVMETADYSSIQSSYERSKNNEMLLKKNGILVLPFETWKSLNKHHRIEHMNLQVSEDFDRRLLILEFLKIQNSELDTFDVGPSVWSKFLWKRKYKNSQESENITCSELVAKIYQNSGVMKKIYTPGSYTTKDFIEGTIELEKGFELI